MTKNALFELQDRFKRTPPGPIAETSGIDKLLFACWNAFAGSDAQATAAEKLVGRMEDMSWNPPVLTFRIERHGGTVQGSTRAEMHRWEVNVDKLTATCHRDGHRQLEPMSSKFMAGPCADQIVETILAGAGHPGLKWLEPGSKVQITLSKIIPDPTFPI